jgi:hypothetical protein
MPKGPRGGEEKERLAVQESAAAALARMPGQLREIVETIAAERRRSRPASGGFSAVEHVCHLRDIDGDGYAVRLERMLSEERPVLADIDGDALARERDYQGQDLAAALAAFTRTREGIVRRLAKVSHAERRRVGLWQGTREMTVDDLVAAMLTHDSEHIEELTALRDEMR